MNKTILCLVLLGLGLAILHVPSVAIHLGIIAGLLIVTIKFFWAMMQSFSSQNVSAQRVSSRTSGWS